MVAVKICGVTSTSDALMCAEAGADAIGLNFYARSPRRVSVEVAHDVVKLLPKDVLTVGVFVDASYDEIASIQAHVGFRCIQLHGDEPPELLESFLPHAYKALRVQGPSVVGEAARFGGEHILLDAYVLGQAGGTGATFDWSVAADIARTRKVTLAGGLTPQNVAQAVTEVQPFCVDVASGVESAPGKKEQAKVRDFIHRAKGLQTAAR